MILNKYQRHKTLNRGPDDKKNLFYWAHSTNVFVGFFIKNFIFRAKIFAYSQNYLYLCTQNRGKTGDRSAVERTLLDVFLDFIKFTNL